jgi:hypothetical protein
MGIKRSLPLDENGKPLRWTKEQATASTEPVDECPEKPKGTKKKQPKED